MPSPKKLVILGDSAFAEVAYEYFTHDSDYEVIAFSVESKFIDKTELFGLPIVEFERLEDIFDPSTTSFYAAVVYTQLNRLRARLYNKAKKKGFTPASYISSRAFIWPNVELGEHCFIFEDNTLQPFVKIENNVVLWSGNHIGHHCKVKSHCFVASHAVVSGFCELGEYSFLGVNATISNNITLGCDNWIGPGVLIVKNTNDGLIFQAPASNQAKIPSLRFFKVSK